MVRNLTLSSESFPLQLLASDISKEKHIIRRNTKIKSTKKLVGSKKSDSSFSLQAGNKLKQSTCTSSFKKMPLDKLSPTVYCAPSHLKLIKCDKQ